MYTDDATTQIVLAMLKEYGVKNIVASPGTRNYGFVESVQQDDYFNVYSVIDERSAAYFAVGMAYESGEPVVITCTGATASRNYLSALTESYYRNLPVIALTCGHEGASLNSLTPQYTDRSISQNDVKLCSVTLPSVVDKNTAKSCELMLNMALTKALCGVQGPVHINLLSLSYTLSTPELPKVNKVDYYGVDDVIDDQKVQNLAKNLYGKKVGIFIGSHKKMSDRLTAAINSFATAYGAAVFCDHTSNYHGENKVLIGQALDVAHLGNMPEVLIDMGGICGQYSYSQLFKKGEIWRISEDGVMKQRAGCLKKLFDCSEILFFESFAKTAKDKNHYYESVKERIAAPYPVEEMLLSNTFISAVLSSKLPKNSALHMSVLNSLRNMNMFDLDESINGICNVGGFGIDGPVSTLAGQSMTDKNRLYFGLIGDLAFFYDMNIICNRHIDNNVRIMLVNNEMGVEFRLNKLLKEDVDPFVAARGHTISAKAWVESAGFHYISAKTKEEFMANIDDFCSADVNHFGKPVVMEVFTTPEDEVSGVRSWTAAISGKSGGKCSGMVKAISCFIPDKEKRREFRKKHTK